MAHYTLRDGRFEHSDSLSPSNRGYLYGDGFFESILCVDGKPSFWKWREKRIERALAFLWMKPTLDTVELLSALRTALKTEGDRLLRARMTFFRKGNGRYLPQRHDVGVSLHIEAIDADPFEKLDVRSVGLSSVTLPISAAGNHKLLSKHWQVLAAIEGHEQGLDDMILLNDEGEVAENIAGNLFAVFKDAVITPSLDSSCLDGVARRALLELEHVHEGHLKIDHLLTADALFSANSVGGVSALKFRGIDTKPEAVQQFQDALKGKMFEV